VFHFIKGQNVYWKEDTVSRGERAGTDST